MKDDHRVQFELRQALQAHQGGDLERAERGYRRVLKARPRDPDALNLLGMIYFARKQFDLALRHVDASLDIRPCEPDVLSNRSGVRLALGDAAGAVEDAQAAVKARPTFAAAYNNLANALLDLFQFQEAYLAYEQALKHDPFHAEAWSGRSLALFRTQRLIEAEASVRHALALNSTLLDAWSNLGIILRERGLVAESIDAINRALSIDPTHPDSLYVRGMILTAQGKPSEAIADIKAARSKKRLLGDTGEYLLAKTHICDWSGLEDLSAEIVTLSASGRFCVVPFSTLGLFDHPDLHRWVAQLYVRAIFPPQTPITRSDGSAIEIKSQPSEARRLRVAYLSADFRAHPVSYLLIDTLECHDRARFETIGLSIGPPDHSAFAARVQAAFDRFIDARDMSDEDLAGFIADQKIDILVDLLGFTQHARTSVLARRPAPIQVNFLGYPGTMGAPYVDYIIADEVVAQDPAWFDEALCLLPDTYQPNSAPPIAPALTERRDHGLCDDAFVFCCFCNNWKILPDVFESWMRILAQKPGSVLWLLANNETVIANLRASAAVAGIQPERLIFAPRMPHAEHIARQALADLMLDTFPYGAHTTASDAIRMGVPLITRSGKSFQSRVARSVLRAAGLEQYAVDTTEDYEALALKLAHDPAALAKAKQATVNARSSALFDTSRYVRHLEAAYLAMAERAAAGLAPSRIEIEPIDVV
jgi:predicted O-linked N-acetylglucosamine transferase (SPINDLY family)